MIKYIQKGQQNTSQHGRMIEKQSSPDFLDPAHKWHHCGGRVHCFSGSLSGADQRSFNESGPIISS